jgi:Pyridine nucleotide-disulphide oxidoreductase
MEKFEAVGIDVRTGTVVESIEKTGTGYRIEASSNEQSMTFEADLVVLAAGRVPNLGSLALDRAGVGRRRFRLQANVFALNRETTGNPAVVEAKGLQYLIDHVAQAQEARRPRSQGTKRAARHVFPFERVFEAADGV